MKVHTGNIVNRWINLHSCLCADVMHCGKTCEADSNHQWLGVSLSRQPGDNGGHILVTHTLSHTHMHLCRNTTGWQRGHKCAVIGQDFLHVYNDGWLSRQQGVWTGSNTQIYKHLDRTSTWNQTLQTSNTCNFSTGMAIAVDGGIIFWACLSVCSILVKAISREQMEFLKKILAQILSWT